MPRPEYASPVIVIIAMMGVIIALYGTVKLKPAFLIVFLQYFIPVMLIIYCMLNRNHIMQFVLDGMKKIAHRLPFRTTNLETRINQAIEKLHESEFIFFSKADDIATLNKVMMYVEENEITRKIKIVTITNSQQVMPPEFRREFEVLDKAYPDIKMEQVLIEGQFGPEMINTLSKKWKIPEELYVYQFSGRKIQLQSI